MHFDQPRAFSRGSGIRRPRARLAAHSTLAAWLLSACYGYVPVAQPPAAEAQVRVTLTDAGTATMVGAVGPSIELIDGRLVRADADSVVLGVTQTTSRRGVESDWRGERIAVPRSGVATVEARRLSRVRTALAVAGGVAVLVAGAVGFNRGVGSGGSGVRPLPTPQ